MRLFIITVVQVLHRLVEAGIHQDTPKRASHQLCRNRESFVQASCTGLQVDRTALAAPVDTRYVVGGLFTFAGSPIRRSRGLEASSLGSLPLKDENSAKQRILALQVNRCKLDLHAKCAIRHSAEQARQSASIAQCTFATEQVRLLPRPIPPFPLLITYSSFLCPLCTPKSRPLLSQRDRKHITALLDIFPCGKAL